MDLRGHGESDHPTDPSAYTPDKMGQDILAVADASEIEQFALWGMSYGGKVGRYLAVHSERIASLILMGTPLGPGVSGARRQQALDFLAHWSPILHAQRTGALELDALAPEDRDTLDRLHIPPMLGWVRAMLDWPSIEPEHFRCPTLWLIGSEDQHAMESLREYRSVLHRSRVNVHIVQGLDHDQVFDEIDQVLPAMLAFAQRTAKGAAQ